MPKTATFLFWHLYWGLENKRKSLFAKWLHYIILYCNLFWKRKKSPYNLFRFIWSLFGLWWTIKSRSWYTETGIRGHGIRYLHKLKITLLALNLSVLGILYEFISVKSLRNSYFIWHFSFFFSARNPFEHNPPNPFQATKVQKPAMNQLLQQQSSKFVFFINSLFDRVVKFPLYWAVE